MEDLIPQIEKTSKLVQEISAASVEQNSGADQVNNAIQQLNNVTQQNAASSEELATSSEEMASQAEQLKELMAFFKVDIDVKSSSANAIQKNMVHSFEPIAQSNPDSLDRTEGNGHEGEPGLAEKLVSEI